MEKFLDLWVLKMQETENESKNKLLLLLGYHNSLSSFDIIGIRMKVIATFLLRIHNYFEISLIIPQPFFNSCYYKCFNLFLREMHMFTFHAMYVFFNGELVDLTKTVKKLT